MNFTKQRAERCVTHHYGCDCMMYRLQEMEAAMRAVASELRSFDPPFCKRLAEELEDALS